MTDSTSQTQHSDHSDRSDIPGRLDFGSICADWGCNKVHPAENHDSYVARYRHSADCDICADYEASRRVLADAGLNRYAINDIVFDDRVKPGQFYIINDRSVPNYDW